MTQMKRWGQVKGDIDYANIAAQVYLATDATNLMAEAGLTPPTTTTKSLWVMGKTFDPASPRLPQQLQNPEGVVNVVTACLLTSPRVAGRGRIARVSAQFG